MHHIKSVEIECSIISSELNKSAYHGDIASEGSEVQSSEAFFGCFLIDPSFDIIRILDSTEHCFQQKSDNFFVISEGSEMEGRVSSVVIECLYFDIFFNLQEGHELQMFAFINQSEHSFAIFFELDSSLPDALQSFQLQGDLWR